MKIQIQQRGGFAGIAQTLVDVDSASVSPAEAKQLEMLARKVEAVAANRQQAESGVGADFLTYDITLQEGQSRRTLTLVDDDSPDMSQVRTVLEQLSALAEGAHPTP